MYNLTLTYKMSKESATATHAVEECYAHVSAVGQHCNMILPASANIGDYENIAADSMEVEQVVLTNEEGEVVYSSDYWNRVMSVNYNFSQTGTSRCEIQFGHKPELDAPVNE